MLTKYSNHVCTFFAADFEPHFGTNLAKAADEIFTTSEPKTAHASPLSHYIFQWPDERELMVLGFRRIFWQTLGFSPWRDRVSEHLSLTKTALKAVGVKEFKRIGFKVQAYLPLDMSHAELSQLMFGSFLAPAEELQEVCSEAADPLVHIEGKTNGFQYVLVLSGMNEEQISGAFLKTGNLDHFRKDKFLDTTVKEFHDNLTRSDCFYFDIDLFQRDVGVDALDTFVKESLAAAEQLANTCVQRLRSQPIGETR